MKQTFILILFLSLIIGCCPCRNLNVSASDSTRVETKVRVEFVSDTIFVSVPVEREKQVTTDSSHLETFFALSDARILSDGRLFHSLENKANKLPVEAQIRVEYRDSIVYQERLVTETLKVNELRPIQRFAICGFWIIFAAFGVFVAYKIGKATSLPI